MLVKIISSVQFSHSVISDALRPHSNVGDPGSIPGLGRSPGYNPQGYKESDMTERIQLVSIE